MHERVAQRVANVPTDNDRLVLSDFTTFNGTKNTLTKVAEYQASRPLAVREDARTAFAPVAYESFTTDGTGGNTETFSLSHDIIKSEATTDNFVLYEGTSEVSEDSIDYANNTFDYTDDGTSNTLHVFYAPGDQARMIIRVTGPNGVQKDLIELDAGLIHRRDRFDSPLRFSFERSLEGVVPDDFFLEQYIDAPYQLKYSHDTGSGTVDATNAILNVPIRRAQEKIDGLARAVRHSIADS